MTKRNFKIWQKVFYAFVIAFMALPFGALKVPEAAAQVALCTQPIDTVIVMDVSNSMGECSDPTYTGFGKTVCETMVGLGAWSDTLLNIARPLAKSFIDNMDTTDQIGLVTFANSSSVVNGLATADGSYQATVKSSIDGLTSGQGGTWLADGLWTAISMLQQGNQEANKKILLFSDGEPTLPTPPANIMNGNDEQSVIDAYMNAAGYDIHIYTFGLSDDAYVPLLSDMADATGGLFYPPVASESDLDYVYESNKYIECPDDPGTVMVCKYNEEQELLDGWEMTLEREGEGWEYYNSGFTGDTAYQYPQGCVVFTDVEAGTYRLSETLQPDWTKVSPEGDYYQFNVTAGYDNTGTPFEFVNSYQEEPETGSLLICKQEDLNGDGVLDDGEPVVPGWTFIIATADYTDEDQDGCVTIEDLDYGIYNVTEDMREGWTQTGASGNGTLEGDGSITVEVGESNPNPIIYFLNQVNQCTPNSDDWNVLDRVNIGDTNSETGHNLVGWSDEWVKPGWGGNYGGGSSDESFRLLMGPGDGCGDGYESASLSFDVGLNYADHITFEHLDGSVDDSFDVLVNDTLIGHYTGGENSGETWVETVYDFSPVTGVVTVEFIATEPDNDWCSNWGQVAFSWVELNNCGELVEPGITVCKRDVTGAPLSGWEMNVQSGSNLVGNGGFETPIVTDHDGKWELFGNDALTYWTVEWRDGGDDPLLEIETSLLWTPYEGNQYAELDTNAPVTIYQDIPTVVGNTYQLSFAFSPRQQVADNQLQVEFGTVNDILVADGSSNSDNDWTVYTYTIAATDTTTRLQFTDQSVADSYGTFLDDVQIFETVSGLTEENGCYEFQDLVYGDYTVTETLQDGWTQIEPEEEYYDVTFDEGNPTPILTFVNRQDEPTGTISVCKYYDYDNDGEYDEPDEHKYVVKASWLDRLWSAVKVKAAYAIMMYYDYPLSGWLMNIASEGYSTEGETDENGCVTFEVPYGEYTVTETPPADDGYHWVQTYPGGDESHTIVIDEQNLEESVYFLNVKADLWGCKYNEQEEKLGGWQIDLYSGYPDEETDEMQWEVSQIAYTNSDETSPYYGCYYFTGLNDGDYRLQEVLQSGWERVSPLDYYEFYFPCGAQNPYDFVNKEKGSSSGGGTCTSNCGDDNNGNDGSGTQVLGYETSFPTLEKTVNQTQVNPGAMLTYSVKVTNSGDLDMTGVVLTDTLPDGFVFADDLTQSKTWEIGVLAGNSDVVFVYDVTVQDGIAAGIYANTAKLVSNEHDPLITEAPVEVVQVKVAGYESLPETGGNSNAWQLALGFMFMTLGYIGFRRFSLN